MNSLRERVTQELANTAKRTAVANATRGSHLAKEEQWAHLRELGRLDDLRDRTAAAKDRVLNNHPEYLEQFIQTARAAGTQIHFAETAADAVGQILGIARQHGARLVVKSKSMVTEEIHLVPALEAAGIETVETDLGEYIIQLAGDPPSHIVGPAMHLDRHDVAGIFAENLGGPMDHDPEALAAVARRVLREKFLTADIGITGANFGVAETGSVVIVTNEGNADLTTSLPRVMITVMGLEKLVASWADLEAPLTILPRTSTGQNMTAYVTAMTGPRRDGELDGPEELHVVILDAGRSQLLGTEYQEALRCIRCGACLDACPVFRQVGGHGYGTTYSGPIGVLITPLLQGTEESRQLLDLCSMCGACTETCPAEIPIHELIREQRADRAMGASMPAASPAAPAVSAPMAGRTPVARQADRAPLAERQVFRLWAWAWSNSHRYRLLAAALRFISRPFARNGYLAWTPGPLAPWGQGRDFPAPAAVPFHKRWAALQQEVDHNG